jgi:hypothetical protein
MAFNDGSLLQVTTQDIIFGLRDEIGAFADKVCQRYSRKALSGVEPIFATADTLGRASTGKAPGSTISDRNAELSSLSYTMLEYSKLQNISKATLTDLEQYMDPLSELSLTLLADVDAGIDLALAALLVNANFNRSQGAATGVWSLTTSTPILDLQNAVDKTPKADTLILGNTSARELARHPDLKERSSNYVGAGSLGYDQMRGVLGEALQIDPARVFVFDAFYNSANEGQTPVLARAAGDLAWVGHSRGLRLYEQDYAPVNGSDTPQNGGLLSVKDEHNRWEIAYRRVLQVVRGDSDLGVYLTGI